MSSALRRRCRRAVAGRTLVCLTEAGASYVRARRQAGVQAFAGLIDQLTDDEVEALAAALPALRHLAELESQDREGPQQ